MNGASDGSAGYLSAAVTMFMCSDSDGSAMSQWCQRARLVVLVLVVISFAWGGVRLADPMPKSPEMRTVDASDPTARIAYDAMMQTVEGNYAYVLWFGNGTHRERAGTVRIDTADRQIAIVDQSGGNSQVEKYGGEEGAWKRFSTDAVWTPSTQLRTGQGVFGKEEAVLASGADVSLVARNETSVVVRVNDTATALRLGEDGDVSHRDDRRASLTLVVDRERGLLRRSVYRTSWLEEEGNTSTRRTSVVVRQYRRWGAVDVRRPAGLPYAFKTMLWDLTNRCPTCEEGDG